MNYSTPNAVRREKSENSFDDIDLSGSGAETTYEEVCAALGIDPEESANNGISEWSNKVTTADAEPLSNKVTKRFRRSDRRDLEALKTIQKIGSDAILSGIDTVSDFQPSHLPPTTNDNTLPDWSHTSDRLKLNMANRVVAGMGHAFSLNLGPKRLQEALAAPAGFSDCLARYINRALKRKLGRVSLFWFQVDVTERGKLHLHGAIESSADDLPRIMEALNGVGGKDWVPSRPGEQQCWFRVQDNPDGWVRYSLEDRAKVRFYLKGGRSHFIAKRLSPLAQTTYDDLRVGRANDAI